ncbi:DNA repair protein RecO [Faecalimonas sp.]
MKQPVIVTGIVLSVTPIGEYDKRVVILTKEKGRISAFAKGARRPNSQFGGAVSPFCFGEFTLYEGRNSYNIMQVHISNYFQELKNDMEATYYGFYFMEFAEYYTREQNDETEMLKLLYQTFRALTKKNISNELIRCIYELKVIYINGEGPQVFQCVKCGNKSIPFVFSIKDGGLLCEKCVKQRNNTMKVDTSTLYAMQYIASSSIEKLYTFTVSEQVLKKLKKIVSEYLLFYVDKTFKSLEILEICLK